MRDYVKIENRDGLCRDLSSGAVINTNNDEYENHMRKRAADKKIREQVQQNAKEINELKSDISEIKQLLISLVNKE